MSVHQHAVSGRTPLNHICQFFDSDESRAECIGAFLLEGYQAGDQLIVVARARYWREISDFLSAHGVPVADAIEKGRISVHDAADTLRRLSPNGPPNATAFDAIIGTLMRETSRRGRVCAYGEMVDILAQRGDFDDVMKLETLWNGLADRVPFSLMCGYSAAHFVAVATHSNLRSICAAHSRVDRSSQDPLAAWLLTAAHNGATSALSN